MKLKLFDKPKISYANHGRFLGWGSSPDADWKLVFSIFLLCVVTVTAYSALLFWQANNETLIQPAPGTQITISRETIRKTASFYDLRTKEFNRLKTIVGTTTDPAIY